MNTFTTAVIEVTAIASMSSAQVWPNIPGPMRHVMIGLDSATGELTAHIDPGAPAEMQQYPGQVYSGAASVLNDTYYNSQYGWLNDGFVDPGAGNAIWIEAISVSSGLNVYEGGMRPMAAMHSYAPIQGTAGSSAAWIWGGTMTHNWYAADSLGNYEATYNIYVGDAATGAPVSGFTTAQVTLAFTAVPSPATSATLGALGLVAARRRRT